MKDQIIDCGKQLDDAARFKNRYLEAGSGHQDRSNLQSWHSHAHSALSEINTLLLSDSPSGEQRKALCDYQYAALELELAALRMLR